MYVYLDESGDTGVKFRRGGSSRFFTVALLLVDDPLPLHQAVHDLRLRLGLPEAHEFKFGSTGHAYRVAFFQAIRPYPFAVRALVVDKRDSVLARPSPSRYEDLVSRLLTAERAALRDRLLVIDESVQGKGAQARLATALRRALATSPSDEEHLLRGVVFHRSHQDNLLQVVDMAAGAVARAHERGDDQYARLLGRKLRVVGEPDAPPGGASR